MPYLCRVVQEKGERMCLPAIVFLGSPAIVKASYTAPLPCSWGIPHCCRHYREFSGTFGFCSGTSTNISSAVRERITGTGGIVRRASERHLIARSRASASARLEFQLLHHIWVGLLKIQNFFFIFFMMHDAVARIR